MIYLCFFKIYNTYTNNPINDTISFKNKKIAFCFLIYEEINHESLWNNFFKKIDKNKFTIYIHYKNNKPLKYFEKYKLKNCIETCWGCLSIVLAQNLILKEALKDKDNKHFIWLSDSCIPVKSFDYIYNYLDTTKSYFNMAPDEQVFPRGNNILKFIDRKNIKKAGMPSIICRNHAKLFLEKEKNIKLWFKEVNNVDEIVYITLLHYYNLVNDLIVTPNLSANAIIFTAWNDMINYKEFKDSIKKGQPNNYSYICPEELDYIVNSKSLFARKFDKGCIGLDKLHLMY